MHISLSLSYSCFSKVMPFCGVFLVVLRASDLVGHCFLNGFIPYFAVAVQLSDRRRCLLSPQCLLAVMLGCLLLFPASLNLVAVILIEVVWLH